MSAEPDRMQILQMIEDGKITAAEGLRMLDALKPEAEAPLAAEGAAAPAPAPAGDDPVIDYYRRWWQWPMAAGAVVVLLGALLMYAAYTSAGIGFWLLCASVPFMAGVLLVALAAGSRSARWIHLRVNTGRDEWPRKISLSFPLPLRPAAWALRTFGHHIPALEDHGVDELLLALAETTSAQAPLFIDVHEGPGGERVQLYVG